MARSKRETGDAPPEALQAYRDRRDFSRTPEPGPDARPRTDALQARAFVVQKHWASHLHYDFRLELGGTLKSWAVPKGPSLDPRDKRMAVHVEDHPLSYGGFEGEIPAGQYGAGRVIVWDAGTWEPVGDPAEGYRAGRLKFDLRGRKLQGRWSLVRMRARPGQRESWLLIKDRDAHARSSDEYAVTEALPDSVVSAPDGRTVALPAARDGGGPRAMGPSSGASGKGHGNRAADAAPVAGPEAPARRLAGATGSELPERLEPQLATLVAEPPPDAQDWLYEMKFDGYRLLTRVDGPDGGDVRCFTRTGKDWTHRFAAVVEALRALRLPPCWLDGEVVVPGQSGVPDFQALQNAFEARSRAHFVYYLFDLPYCDGQDLRRTALADRKGLLSRLLRAGPPSDHLAFSEGFDAAPADLSASACGMGFEGIIGKRRDSAYVGARSADWIKLKCSRRQEFVIGGYTPGQGARKALGALLLGVHDERGRLRPVGSVGTGFTQQSLRELVDRLRPLAWADSPFAGGGPVPRQAQWVAPTLVAEVSFAEWTRTGRIRQAVFHGLRMDKPPREVTREAARPARELPRAAEAPARVAPASRPGAGGAQAEEAGAAPAGASIRITHPARLVDARSGTRKRDLVHAYARLAPLILPHLAGRPVALQRAPEGLDGELFFQKHAGAREIRGLRRLDPALDPGHAPLLEVPDAAGLLSAVQMNVVEFHTWNARSDRIGAPDRIAFDLDPGEGVPWAQVQAGARLVHAFLDALGLASFLKTSGGKGLHVVVPLDPVHDWDTVRGFAQAAVQHLAKTLPQRFVARSGARNRVGRIFVDYLRNGRGATTVAAWSLRARPGIGLSVPVDWDELPDLAGGAHWSIGNLEERLDIGNAPWDGYGAVRQTLDRAAARIDMPARTGSAARGRRPRAG
ncbi:MAG: DNA ligase D [Xylophilus ampelinus]